MPRDLPPEAWETVSCSHEMSVIPETAPAPVTEESAYWKCWKLHTRKGRQYWEFVLPDHLKEVIRTEADWEKPEGRQFLEELVRHYRFDTRRNPNSADRVYRSQVKGQTQSQPMAGGLEDRARDAARRGFAFYTALQTEDGNWPGDYGGPLFLTPGLIIAAYITDTPFPAPYRELLKQYFLNHQHADGGWGLHIEDQSTMFGTALQYVALRLLGLPAGHEAMQRAGRWIRDNGGATQIPAWGKFYLSLLGVYKWEGNNSLFPELWLLPKAWPIHPSKYWSHCRLVYLPMSYCYANRITAPENDLIRELRTELYPQPYEAIDWKKARYECHISDRYFPITGLYRFFSRFTHFYERVHSKRLRRKALKFTLDYIRAEDEQTSYINIGPVNQAINSICVWHAYGRDSEEFQKHAERWYDFLWVAEDGMKMNGYNGSQLWDTTFAGLALLENDLQQEFPQAAQKIYRYLDHTQAREHVVKSEQFYRSASKGTWPFSTAEQAWPVTDCTAEAMKLSIALHHSGAIPAAEQNITGERLQPAVDMLLAYQNKDGGWSSYEESRGPGWLEQLNPAEIFGEIMIEHSYVECSSATMQGLAKFRKEFPEYRSADIEAAMRRGEKFIRSIQRTDGSWYGSWAVCFTYGTWFGIEGLLACGAKGYDQGAPDDAIRRACEFLLSIQRSDGSWGESYRSCVEKKYIPHAEGQIINTAWALMALLAAGYPDRAPIDRGIEFILRNQEPTGDWPQQGISGVFNHNCMITYTAYRNVFPLWALGRYQRKL